MRAPNSHPALRLVNSDAAASPHMMPGRHADAGRSSPAPPMLGRSPRGMAEERIARENHSAASLSALDPRWVLAVQVSRELQGGRAAVIAPDSRKRLLVVGERLGLRSFDTNLVIAIVQDGARAGEDPLGDTATARLRWVGQEPELADAKGGPTWGHMAVWMFAAAAMGAAVTMFLVRLLG